MLILSRSILGRNVLSLRTGGVVASADKPIINPNNLKIEGFYCTDNFSKETLVLLTQDIRDTLSQGYVIDDHDVLASPTELIRLKEVLEIGFDIMEKPVYTTAKKKIGKVNDYAADSETLYIQKLYIGQSLIRSLSSGQLSVDRNQVVEITNRKIIIKDPQQLTKARAAAPAAAPAV